MKLRSSPPLQPSLISTGFGFSDCSSAPGRPEFPPGRSPQHVGISPTGMSFHLKELEHAGLVTSTRDGRFVRYAVHVEGMRQLLTYLTEDCCRGKPELCGTVIKKARATRTREKA